MKWRFDILHWWQKNPESWIDLIHPENELIFIAWPRLKSILAPFWTPLGSRNDCVGPGQVTQFKLTDADKAILVKHPNLEGFFQKSKRWSTRFWSVLGWIEWTTIKSSIRHEALAGTTKIGQNMLDSLDCSEGYLNQAANMWSKNPQAARCCYFAVMECGSSSHPWRWRHGQPPTLGFHGMGMQLMQRFGSQSLWEVAKKLI